MILRFLDILSVVVLLVLVAVIYFCVEDRL